MLIRKWRGGPVRGTPASFRLNGVGGLSALNRDGRSTAGTSTTDGWRARYRHPLGQSPARSVARVWQPGGGLRGAGNSIRKWDSF